MDTIKSTNYGQTWATKSDYSGANIHADVRCVLFQSGILGNFGATDQIWVGTDGGVMANVTGGGVDLSWTLKNGGPVDELITSELYGLDVSEADPNLITGGAQDNGLMNWYGGTWTKEASGDGFHTAIYHNPNGTPDYYIYGETSSGSGSAGYTPDNSIYASTNYGQGFVPTADPLQVSMEDRPIMTYNGKLYTGYVDIFESPISANLSWTAKTPFATDPNFFTFISNTTNVVSTSNGQFIITLPLSSNASAGMYLSGPGFSSNILITSTNSSSGNIVAQLASPLPSSFSAGTSFDLYFFESGIKAMSIKQVGNSPQLAAYIAHPNASWSAAPLKHFFMRNLTDITQASAWEDKSNSIIVLDGGGVPHNVLLNTGVTITGMATDPENFNKIWLTLSGFGFNRVVKSTDGGDTWIDYSEGLELWPVNCIVFQKGTNDALYIGTDRGVFYRTASMNQWQCFDRNLPVCVVRDLKINYCNQKLRAATFGRGIWESDLAGSPVTLGAAIINWNTPTVLTSDFVVPSGCSLNISADVSIARGRKITVQSGGKLRMTSGGRLYNACGEMWDGVYVESGGIIDVQNAFIQDAYQAFNLLDGSLYYFNNNQFDANYIGINFGDITMRHSLSGGIIGNSFQCLGTFPPYFGQVIDHVTPNTRPLCGIRIQNVDYISLGKTGANPNSFRGIENGILSYSSNMIVNNALFEEIHNHQYYNPWYMGSGVYSESNGQYSVKVYGANQFYPDFLNCDYGVNIENQNFDVMYNWMSGVDEGIRISHCATINGYINKNNLHCNRNGVSLFHNDLAKKILVNYNKIEIGEASATTVSGSYGISVEEFSHCSPHINLILNDITVDYGFNGIYVLSCEHVLANGNSIILKQDNNNPDDPNANVTGIEVDNCNDTYFYSNIVVGSNLDVSSTQIGIEANINAGYANQFGCNSTSQTLRNFDFGGGAMTSVLSGNSIGSGYEGLHITGNCSIGIQDHSGNCFDGTYGNPNGAAINLNTQFLYLLWSAFIVNDQSNSCYLPQNNHLPGDWFRTDYSKDEFTCNAPGCNPCNKSTLQAIDNEIALDQIGSTYYTEQVKWEGRKYLLEKLNNYPDLMTGNQLLQSFHDTYSNTPMDALIHVGFGMLDADQMTTVQALQYELNDSIIVIDLDSMEHLSIALGNETNPIVQESLKNQISTLSSQTRILQLSNKNILENFKNQKEQNLVNVNLNNSAIVSGELIEENLKKVHDIYLRTFAQSIYSIDESDEERLWSIASQCPYEGGPGVYMARSMYGDRHSNVTYSDKYNCAQLGYLRTRPGKTEFVVNTAVVPNPVGNKASLMYSISETSSALCQIYNGIGKKIMSFNLESGSNQKEFDTENLTNGIYYYLVTSDGATISSGQFNVSK